MTHTLPDRAVPTSTLDPGALPRSRPALGLVMPDILLCGHCHKRIIVHIFYDGDIGRLSCLRCARLLSVAEPGRFTAISVDARGLLPGVDYLPAGQAIAVLVHFGAIVA